MAHASQAVAPLAESVITPRQVAAALAIGPLAHYLAGRRRRAGLIAIPWGLALLAYAYTRYFPLYLVYYDGGDTIRAVTDAAVRATEVWLRSAPHWMIQGWWVLALANLGCAADLARLARR